MENVESDERIDRKGEDEEEEEKIEQFFALIRSFREAHNRRKIELKEMEERKKKKRKVDEEQPSWVPSFQFEDFNEEIEFRRPPIIFPGKHKEDKKVENQEDEGGLDLKLTL